MNTIHGSFTNAATGKTLACGSSVSSLLILIYKILKLKTKFTIYQRYFYYQFMYSTLLGIAKYWNDISDWRNPITSHMLMTLCHKY